MRPPCDCFSRFWNQGISKALARPRLWSRLSFGLLAIFCLATALSAEPPPEAISAYERAQAALENHGEVPGSLVTILGSSKLRHWGYVREAAWSPDGSLLASVGNDRYLRLWNADTGEQVKRFQSAPEGEGAVPGLIALAFDPAGKRLAAVTTTNAVRIWNVETGAESHFLKDDIKVADVAWHPTRPLLATGGELTAKLWDLATGKIVRVLDSQDKSFKRKYSDDAVCLAFSPDGRQAVVGHPDGSVRF